MNSIYFIYLLFILIELIEFNAIDGFVLRDTYSFNSIKENKFIDFILFIYFIKFMTILRAPPMSSVMLSKFVFSKVNFLS